MRAAGGLKLCFKLKVNTGSIYVFSHSGKLAERIVLILDMFLWCNNARKMKELADIYNHF